MKLSIKAVIASTLLIAATSTAQASASFKEARYTGDVAYSSFCKAVVLDDVSILRASVSRQVGRVGVSERQVLRLVTSDKGPMCNGESLVDFSKQRNATAVLNFLSSYNR